MRLPEQGRAMADQSFCFSPEALTDFAQGIFRKLGLPPGIGHLFMAVRPDLFMPMDEFKKRMDVMIDRFVSSPKAEGVDRLDVHFPEPIDQSKIQNLKFF
jgi:LDH2 family malate/lactate/ureidoglycolate dehydrogenase